MSHNNQLITSDLREALYSDDLAVVERAHFTLRKRIRKANRRVSGEELRQAKKLRLQLKDRKGQLHGQERKVATSA